MEIEISKAGAAETPAATMTNYVTEHVTALMTLGGIESISARRYSSGFGTRLHVTMAPFSEAPEEVREQGIVIKDAISTILSIANVTRVVIKPDEKDMDAFKESWAKAVESARHANGESAQDTTERSKEN